MKLSILIPTVPTRVERFFPKITTHIDRQISNLGRKDIELLGLLDNRVMTIGEKRNRLLDMARGEFLVFIDDDDRVHDEYVESVISALDNNPNADCVVYDSICYVGNVEYYCKYGTEYEYTKLEPWSYENTRRPRKENWFGKPAHTMVYRSTLAKRSRFPSLNAGEDFDWVAKTWPLIKKQVRIDKVLYYYDVVLGKTH